MKKKSTKPNHADMTGFGDWDAEGTPHSLNIGSSCAVPGWIWNLPSHKAAEDRDGSYLAGSESEPRACGAQPAPMEDATRLGTMVIIDELDRTSRSAPQLHGRNFDTHRGILRTSWMRAERLLPTKDDARKRPPRRFAKVARLSRTSSMAEFHSVFGLTLGNTSGCGRR